jgi:hypothetical protein
MLMEEVLQDELKIVLASFKKAEAEALVRMGGWWNSP